ncbi:GNAT family N-acetyltransferase [Legionella pneumophila]|uniref:Acyltransferase n=1 Tax=Legionella pneumophila subsp. pascullei TaxID=91890 RepID=A0AAX2IXN9_LEGPN|nr:GNAT family N-acetyltransferase [Legionella pneumophila]AMP88979.1 GNAT family N-acetyltransferase [Legionella pneumophila subsp. pascullei]AMP93353.1 acetyltransferase [Legionella pneumophila subsp. pascullei]AMP96319.1 acetyltransferase [Legionella pneumophila subsp. pascullei]SQG91286.1 acyltransferase [Legionella pneumophila subsp. pascullei]VEH07832.1 acyltransferase [Legionella pneumophila subsp. pascullei]
MLQFKWYEFSDLTSQQLYDILALRANVFVVEQHCSYLDPDGKDFFSIHLLGLEENSLVAYLRLFLPTEIENHLTFGRVVTAKSVRSKGYGRKLIRELLSYCDLHYPGIRIQCSAQNYLKKFYEGYGFKGYGEIYEEDGIPHLAMQRTL